MPAQEGKKSYVKSALSMDTVIQLKVVTARPEAEVDECMTRAFEAFRYVETVCSRFLPDSEVMRLCMQVGTPVQVSDLLFEAIRFAWEVANLTEGAFDPTVGRKMEAYGFNRHYLSGQHMQSNVDPTVLVSYQDVVVEEDHRTIQLRKPLVLDLGAVAKGLAVDLAAKELRSFEGFLVDAGGDIYAGGLNEREEPWVVGVRHPVQTDKNIFKLQLTDVAICTSGSYERVSKVRGDTHHLIDPRSGNSQTELLSCTVVAPYAMMADAFSTAAFIQGQERGMELLEEAGLEGLLISSQLDLHISKEMKRYLHERK